MLVVGSDPVIREARFVGASTLIQPREHLVEEAFVVQLLATGIVCAPNKCLVRVRRCLTFACEVD